MDKIYLKHMIKNAKLILFGIVCAAGAGLHIANAGPKLLKQIGVQQEQQVQKDTIQDKKPESRLSIYPTQGFSHIVGPALSSLVCISATVKKKSNVPDMGEVPDGPLRDFFNDFFGQHGQGNGKISKITALGSGFIIDQAGYIVTNHHVIKHVLLEKGTINITLSNGHEHVAKVIGVDRRTDLALLKIDINEKLSPLRWGDSFRVKTGDLCFALGNPYGIGSTATFGMVSSTGRDLEDSTHSWIQTDAAINPGNSGGPLINVDGEVVGVNTVIITNQGGGNIGLAFAIPSSLAAKVISELKQHGFVRRGFIGVTLSKEYNENIARSLGLPSMTGVLISEVVQGSPAEKASIKAGDIIMSINNTTVQGVYHFRNIIGDMKAGTVISIKIWRNRKEQAVKEITATVTVADLGEREREDVVPSQRSDGAQRIIGMVLKDINGKVIVHDVDADKPVSDELNSGDEIIQVGQQDIKSVAECTKLIEELVARGKKNILFLIVRKGERKHVMVKL